jgi:hypothetical protein
MSAGFKFSQLNSLFKISKEKRIDRRRVLLVLGTESSWSTTTTKTTIVGDFFVLIQK